LVNNARIYHLLDLVDARLEFELYEAGSVVMQLLRHDGGQIPDIDAMSEVM